MLFEPVSNVSKPFLGFPKKNAARKELKKESEEEKKRGPSTTEAQHLRSIVFLRCTAGIIAEPRTHLIDGTDELSTFHL
jgi:hypothetical protein